MFAKDYIVILDPACGNGESEYDWLYKKYTDNISHEAADIHRAKLVVFTGGSDVSPSLYNEKKLVGTYINETRDELEQTYYHAARSLNIPMTGICRGAQFLCVMHGGKLYQDVSGHEWGYHSMQTMYGQTLRVNTLHHQMMIPRHTDTVLGWSKDLSKEYKTDKQVYSKISREPEAVRFSDSKTFVVQYHPELLESDHEGVEFYRKHLEQVCNL